MLYWVVTVVVGPGGNPLLQCKMESNFDETELIESGFFARRNYGEFVQIFIILW